MQLPGPVRAVVGLVASAADEAKHLPDRAVELPMLAVSTALQMSLRAQQRYARLTARGDEALSRRRTGDDPPEWATFDDPVVAPVADDTTAPSVPVEPPAQAPATARKAARKTPRKAAGKKAATRKAAGPKSVSAPRHTTPSRFDRVTDDTSPDDVRLDDTAADLDVPPGDDAGDR
jgi:hypothetical protein